MNRAPSIVAVPLVLAVSACGGPAQEAESPEPAMASTADAGQVSAGATAVEEPPSTEAASPLIPTTCHKGEDPCTPDPAWVKKACQDVYPAVALYLNQPTLPFTKGYLTRKTKAVNASGGATSGEEWLRFDEQVVLLYHRKVAEGGMQVSGAGGGFEAMRWDGSCVTLDSTEVTLSVPPKPVYAHIPWRYLGEDIEDALKEAESVREAYIARKQECKGAFSGAVSKKCVSADERLDREIVNAVETGAAKLPVPERRP